MSKTMEELSREGYYIGLAYGEMIDYDEDDRELIQRVTDDRGLDFTMSSDFVMLIPGSKCPSCNPKLIEDGEV